MLALLGNPDIVILDEPTAGLDVEGRVAIHREIRKLKEQGKTIILIEHNLPITMKACDRIVVLSYGKKIAEGVPEEIRRNPQVIEAYLGEEDESDAENL